MLNHHSKEKNRSSLNIRRKSPYPYIYRDARLKSESGHWEDVNISKIFKDDVFKKNIPRNIREDI